MKRIIIFICVLILVYLFGAFYALSFNIADWASNLRALALFSGFSLGLVLSCAPNTEDMF